MENFKLRSLNRIGERECSSLETNCQSIATSYFIRQSVAYSYRVIVGTVPSVKEGKDRLLIKR